MTTLTNAQVSFLLSNLVGNNTYVIFDYYVVPGNRFQFGGITDTLNDDSIANYTKGSHAIYDINADVYDKNAERAFTVFQDNGVDLAEYTYLMISTLEGESTYILLWGDITYDIHFNDENNSNNKGFKQTFEYCKNYIEQSNGTGESYFESYKNGTASIVCNETSETVYEEEIETPVKATVDGYEHAKVFESASNYIVDLRTGLGKGFYPKDIFSLEDAISDAVADHSC